MKKALLSIWSLEGGEQGIGNAELLRQPVTAFFASRQCPGGAIRAAMDWAVEQSRIKRPVISGFHSPLERSVLEVLLTAGSPCVIVIARKLNSAHLPSAWLSSLQAGEAAIVSIADAPRRLTVELAARRNNWIVEHAARIVVAYASPTGELEQQVGIWKQRGLTVDSL